MRTITNPVLPGFHPDPSICRRGKDIYIATSTFDWFPGVMIYHSTDLVNWKLVARPLDRLSLLDMAGNPPSGGIWAPCLSYDEQTSLFYLVYTNMRTWVGSPPNYLDGFKDQHNYVVTAEDVSGQWSEPVYLNSSGFDPSLFHDDNGKKWLVNMRWDYRVKKNHFSGIVLQEYDPQSKKLVGDIHTIFLGTGIGLTEGPHLYKRKGWYYLLLAEGGTSYGHAVSLVRSKNLMGPYEWHPRNPILSSVQERASFLRAMSTDEDPFVYLHAGLQKAGHASICEWKDDEWVMAHLCGRPLPHRLECPLGRETALQPVIWREDDWLYPATEMPEQEIFFIGNEVARKKSVPFRADFNSKDLEMEFQFLRQPPTDNIRLDERHGWLRLYGRESIRSRFQQSLIARRVQSFCFSAETCMEFSPKTFNHMAGLILRYDDDNQYYLRMSYDDERNSRVLGLLLFDNKRFSMPLQTEIMITSPRVYLKVQMKYQDIQFFYSVNSKSWKAIGPKLDAGVLSDEHAEPLGFMGMFVGLCCQDLASRSVFADFDYLEYREE